MSIDDESSKKHTDPFFVNSLLGKERLTSLSMLRNQNSAHSSWRQEHLADLQSLGGVREHLADLQSLGGVREHLADLQSLGGVREHLADLQSLGGVREHLADLQSLGGVREHLADLQSLGGVREHLADLRALTTVHEWANVTGLRQRLEEINFEGGFTGLKQRLADLNGVAGINWSARLAELQILSPIIDGVLASPGIPFDDHMFRAAYEVAAYAELNQKNEGLGGLNQSNISNEPESNYQSKRFSDLPLQVQNVVLKFMYNLLIALLAGLIVLAIQEKYFSKAESSNELSSPREIKKLTRCNNSWDREALSQCRLVNGYNVKLRSKPNQKADELATLSLGSTLRILDTYNRSWLKVEVVSEDITAEGWVLRRYTEYFR
ncbi:SH3 domain-containing protein [Halomonas venusta]|uniref:SH3 domain-containing protein n=1 Tax=Vreelandella venusta TaxID=44935 RepID=UPI00295EF389|nr:SH3 domain-containing protein [Halomonas venusta]MDW0357824.1 SH3 domain-containing protein [Halomonas venusta]